MDVFKHVLKLLHFIGLAMGMSVSIGNIVMAGVMAKDAPPEKAVLARFPPALSAVGRIGFGLLVATGLTMVYVRWDGFGSMPPLFFVKLTFVALLALTVGYAHSLEARAHQGDTAAAARMPKVGKLASLFALTVVTLAVFTFN